MGLIREPLDVDFYVVNRPLTDKDRKEISVYIQNYKKKKPLIAKSNSNAANKLSSGALDKLIHGHHIYMKHVLIVKKFNKMFVLLNTGNTLNLNLSDFPRLKSATEKQLNNWKIISRGMGIHWKDLDEDLSLKGFISSIKPTERRTVIKKLSRNEDMIFA